MGMYSCPCRSAPEEHGHEYVPMAPAAVRPISAKAPRGNMTAVTEPSPEILARRARREARRERQRAENVHRAAAMHVARLAYEREHPPQPAALPKSQRFYVGCSGWYYWHWRGDFYPADLP